MKEVMDDKKEEVERIVDVGQDLLKVNFIFFFNLKCYNFHKNVAFQGTFWYFQVFKKFLLHEESFPRSFPKDLASSLS